MTAGLELTDRAFERRVLTGNDTLTIIGVRLERFRPGRRVWMDVAESRSLSCSQ